MLKKILIALAAIVIFLIVVALQPADFRLERTATIAAPHASNQPCQKLINMLAARRRCQGQGPREVQGQNTYSTCKDA